MSEKKSKRAAAENDEIDLGQLFNLIGNAFQRLFNWIGSLLGGLFGIVVAILVVLRRHFIWLSLTFIVAAFLGYIFERVTPEVYGANMLVQPNFQSANQLYNNMHYYNSLVESKDVSQLSKIFHLSTQEAEDLKGFYIQPLKSESNLIEKYAILLKAIDSSARKEINFETYKQNIQNTDYSIHEIGVASKDKDLFKKIDTVILNTITKNEFFRFRQKQFAERLKRSDSLLLNSLSETDSVLDLYRKVMILEAKKNGDLSGTSIVMSESAAEEDKLKMLLERKLEIRDQLDRNDSLRVQTKNVINVLSEFPDVGYVENTFFRDYKKLFGTVAVCIYLLVLGLIPLNKYLRARDSNYKN